MRKIDRVEEISKILNKEEIEESVSISSNIKGCRNGFTITKEMEEFDNLKTKVFKYISYKKRTENEIRQKFEAENQNMLEEIIEIFKEQNYINEKEYIERTVKEFINLKNLSLKEIIYKLLQKGINKKELDRYILENKDILLLYEITSAQKIIQKKKDKMETEYIKKYLFQKGYLSESISIALEENF